MTTALVNIKVELFGRARIVCGQRVVDIAVPEMADASDVVAVLAESCPALLDTAIREDCTGLRESYSFNLNGVAFIGDERLHLKPGDALLLFSSQAGG